MILTTSEKAKRYDALQTAIKHTIEQWEQFRARCMSNYNAHTDTQIGAFDYGKAEGLRQAAEAAERWVE